MLTCHVTLTTLTCLATQVGRHLLAQRQYPIDCGLLVDPKPSLPGAFHASAVLTLSYSSDASRLLSSSADKTARVIKLPLSKYNGEGTDFIGMPLYYTILLLPILLLYYILYRYAGCPTRLTRHVTLHVTSR